MSMRIIIRHFFIKRPFGVEIDKMEKRNEEKIYIIPAVNKR
jgi:hypothetical protein